MARARPDADLTRFDDLAARIRACDLCAAVLPLGPRPVFQADPRAPVLIVGQAPGRRVHVSGLPFDDPSGDRLRRWLGVDRAAFYDPRRFALVPMGFCYPGTGSGGDLPPRPECAAAWRERLLAQLSRVELTLVLGRYARDWHLPEDRSKSMAHSVERWRTLPDGMLVLPHPSPRNQGWFRDHPWFELELVPTMRAQVARLLDPAPAGEAA